MNNEERENHARERLWYRDVAAVEISPGRQLAVCSLTCGHDILVVGKRLHSDQLPSAVECDACYERVVAALDNIIDGGGSI